MSINPEWVASARRRGQGANYLLCYNHVVSGLKKRGVHMTTQEAGALQGAIISPVICPAFDHRLVAEHGADSLLKAFYMRDHQRLWRFFSGGTKATTTADATRQPHWWECRSCPSDRYRRLRFRLPPRQSPSTLSNHHGSQTQHQPHPPRQLTADLRAKNVQYREHSIIFCRCNVIAPMYSSL